jgi:RNA 2',3'-cyclic 3'-phosphodiesterase
LFCDCLAPSVGPMAEERQKDRRGRMFVALDLPDGVRGRLSAWGKEALVDSALRPVKAESLHMTLAFLGFTAEREVEQIEVAMRESAGPAPLVELLDPVARPTLRRARLFALPAVSPGAEQMQARLGGLLVAAGLYKPEKRDFWPHVTIARVRSEGRGSRRPALVEQPPKELAPGLSEAFYGVRMTLYRSVLQPQGSRYVPLAQVELPGAGWQ